MLRFHAIVTCSGTIEDAPLFQRRSDVLSCGGMALPFNGRSIDLDSLPERDHKGARRFSPCRAAAVKTCQEEPP